MTVRVYAVVCVSRFASIATSGLIEVHHKTKGDEVE